MQGERKETLREIKRIELEDGMVIQIETVEIEGEEWRKEDNKKEKRGKDT